MYTEAVVSDIEAIRGHVVLCVADEQLREAVLAMVADAELTVVSTVTRGMDTVPIVSRTQPNAVIIDLELIGALGLRLVGILRSVSAATRIILICDMAHWGVVALESGADAAVERRDLRPLRDALAV